MWFRIGARQGWLSIGRWNSRTWVLLTEAPDGGWGLAGHANTNEELVASARAQIAELQAKKPND